MKPHVGERSALFVGGCGYPFHLLEPAVEPVRSALEEAGFTVTVDGIWHPDGPSEPIDGDYSILSRGGLKGHDLLVLFTTGTGYGEDVDAVVDFVREGGGLVGIHCAADSFTDHREWIDLLGGAFKTHPAPLDIDVEIVDQDHPITVDVDDFTVHDELYVFQKHFPGRVHLLARTRSHDAGDGRPIPVAWTRTEGRGRVFYLSLGHHPEAMDHPAWRRLFVQGAVWAVGDPPLPPPP
ncbi:MAG: ThuA domain-containing protein, partial [Armatimonadota bacterium]